MAPDHFSRAIDAIYAAAADPSAWSAALAATADCIGGDGGMLVSNDMARNRGTIITARLREDLSELYLQRYIHNPTTWAMMRQQIVEPVLVTALVDPQALRSTEFHADILASQRIEDLVVLPHPRMSQAGSTGGVSITLNAQQAARREAALTMAQRLKPHLWRAVDLSAMITAHGDVVRQISDLIALMPHAALLLDGEGRVIDANDQAAAVLAARDGVLIDRDGRLHVSAGSAGAGRKWASIIRAAIAIADRGDDESGDDGRHCGMRIARPSGKPALLTWATALPPRCLEPALLLERRPRVMVHIIDPDLLPTPRQSALRQLFGLTNAEARVAIMIASGRSTPEVATALGIGTATARTHLRGCFDKMQVRSQVGLARLIAATQAVGPATSA